MRTKHSISQNARQVFVFKSKLGWMAAVGSGESLVSLSFGHGSPQAVLGAAGAVDAQQVAEFDWCPDLAGRLEAYAAGEWVGFDDVPLDVGGMTPFQRRVTELCRRIPFAQTISYAELAIRVGSPGAARAVGNVMAANRCPLIVPCHRVVGADGRVGNYSGPQGVRMKLRLLELERQAAAVQPAVA